MGNVNNTVYAQSSTTEKTGIIEKPTGLNATCTTDGKYIILRWNNIPNAQHYIVSVWQGNKEVVKDVYATQLTLEVTPDKDYAWYLHGNNIARDGPQSDTENFKCSTKSEQLIATPTISKGSIIIQLKDETGKAIEADSGVIYVTNESGSDSDSQDLSKKDQQCFKKQNEPGKYICRKYPDKWFGGMHLDQPPKNCIIVEPGLVRGEDTPISLQSAGTSTIDIILRCVNPNVTGASRPIPTITPNYTIVPNCTNLQGPPSIRLGSSGTYTASFEGKPGMTLFGAISAIRSTSTSAFDQSNWDLINFPPTRLENNPQELSYTWTPTQTGIYQVFCRTFNGSTSECRGAPNSVDAPPRYTCKGPGAVMTVHVTNEAVESAGPISDMCQFSTSVGGNIVTPQKPLTLAAIAKNNFEIKNYTFAFYNQDNKNKPLFFTGNSQFQIISPNNTIILHYQDLDKIDNQSGKKPENILVKTFFTSTNGSDSIESDSCNIAIKLLQPTPTQGNVLVQNTNTNATAQSSGLITTFVIIIIAVVVSLNFFMN